MNPTGQAPATSSGALATTGNSPGQIVQSNEPGNNNPLTQLFNGNSLQNIKSVLAQPAVRKALPFIMLAMMVIVFSLVYSGVQSIPYRAVMPGMQESDQQAAFDALRNADFKPKIDAENGQLTVPSSRYHEARMFLASQGIPKAGTNGIESLKDQSSMTSSQFMEQVKVNAAMQQELARSIMQIASVQGARVHLAMPKQSVFVRDQTPPKASVVITPQPGRVVSRSQVQAIVHLVSSSVPYLSPDNVTVVDNVGKLLTESATELKLGLTAAQEQHKQQMEEVYRQRIVQILAPIVGENNVRSEVNLSLDFSQIESTTEDFDDKAKGPYTRSEVSAEEMGSLREASGVPGALSNSPPANPSTTTNTQADSNKGQTDSRQTTSRRSTKNYEMDRTVRHVRQASGGVMRVSAAVVVNERPAPLPAGSEKPDPASSKSIPYSPEEIRRMNELVQGVVGFNEKRGDLITVIPAKFEPAEPMTTIPWYLEDAVQNGIKNGLIAISFIVFMLIVVRPIMKQLSEARAEAQEKALMEAQLADGELSAEDMRMIQIGEGETLEEIKAKLKPKKSAISADMLDTANTYDDKVALIRMLVAEDSGRVANVLKNMIRGS
jgi:flagellar M-ring protein FliF